MQIKPGAFNNRKSNIDVNSKYIQLPLRSVFSLKMLIQFWQNTVLKEKTLGGLYSAQFAEQLARNPELNEPIEDHKKIEKYRSFIDTLMTAIFPTATGDREIAAALIPFTPHEIYATAAYRRLQDNVDKRGKEPIEAEKKYLVVMLNAYKAILNKFYGKSIEFEFPWIMSVPDIESGLDKYYKIEVDARFVEIRNLKPIKPISSADTKRLHNDLTNIDLWREILPPEDFEFQGFLIYKATDVTSNELLSQLKFSLSKKAVLSSEDSFKELEHKMRSLLFLPELKMGLSGLLAGKNLLRDCGYRVGHSLFLSLTDDFCPVNFQKSIYGKVIDKRRPVMVSDISQYEEMTSIEEEFSKRGIKNIALFPLVYNDQLIGMLELAATNPGEINAINSLKIEGLIPNFVMAIKSNLEELDTRIQGIIKEECTAIHPSVEWRFRDAAYNLIQKNNAGEYVEMEPIIFDHVYSLYGLSDIRGSSTTRNKVIQQDLVEHLTLGKNVLNEANKIKPLPILEELMYRIEMHRDEITQGLNSDEENKVVDFLHGEVEPLFDHLEELDNKVKLKIKKYKSSIDPNLGFVYKKRKDFEDSVARINDMVSAYIDEEEDKAQKMFPHYFEKYKTDGVDYNIYIGSSLVEDKSFNMMYLKNLRLWQLILMSGIVRKSSALKTELKMPLETAHLILIQSTPIAIQFRFDEKRFDVNGAYNVKYEIVKKRIDKAVIKESGERLTQPGKIAIVYSQSRDAQEYREYIKYLQHSGYLLDQVEDVQLEDLQGIQGLRALRVEVNINSKAHIQDMIPENVERAIRELSQDALK